MKKLLITYTAVTPMWALNPSNPLNKGRRHGRYSSRIQSVHFRLVLCLLLALFLTGCGGQEQNQKSSLQTSSNGQQATKQAETLKKVNDTEDTKEAFKREAGLIATKNLESQGLRVYSTTCEWIAADRPYLLIGAMPSGQQSELLSDTAGVSIAFQKLLKDLQALAVKQNMSLSHVILVSPTFRVESCGEVGVNPSIYLPHEGSVLFRTIGKLAADEPLKNFVGAKTIANSWKEVLKVNHAIVDEKNFLCDIIVRQSGVPYCAFKDLFFTLDGKEGYLSSGGKLLAINDFQEVKEAKIDKPIRVLFSHSASGYALVQSPNDGVMTLMNMATGRAKKINLYAVNALYEINSAELIQNDGTNWILFEGADILKKPYIIVMPIVKKGKTVIYECSYSKLEALRAVNESKDKNVKSIKTWIKNGWLLKMPDEVDVERSQ